MSEANEAQSLTPAEDHQEPAEVSPSSTEQPSTPELLPPVAEGESPVPEQTEVSEPSTTRTLGATLTIKTVTGKTLRHEFAGTSQDIAQAIRHIQALGYTEYRPEGMTVYPYHSITEVILELENKD